MAMNCACWPEAVRIWLPGLTLRATRSREEMGLITVTVPLPVTTDPSGPVASAVFPNPDRVLRPGEYVKVDEVNP